MIESCIQFLRGPERASDGGDVARRPARVSPGFVVVVVSLLAPLLAAGHGRTEAAEAGAQFGAQSGQEAVLHSAHLLTERGLVVEAIARTAQALREDPANARARSWLLDALQRREWSWIRSILQHSNDDDLTSATLSPDGTRVVTTSHSGRTRLWDAATGRPVGEPLHPDQSVWGLAVFSRDGRRLFTVSNEANAFWDPQTGQKTGELDAPFFWEQQDAAAADFSPDGTRLAIAASEGLPVLFDADTGESLADVNPLVGTLSHVTFSPDGAYFVTAGSETLEDGSAHDGVVRFWDGTTGEPLGAPLLHDARATFASFSFDGTRLLTVSNHGSPTTQQGGAARLWDVATRTPLGGPLEQPGFMRSASFSRDGTRILTVADDRIGRFAQAQVWDVASGQPLGRTIRLDFTDDSGWRVFSASFSPGGDRILTGGGDTDVRLWDAVTGEPIGEPLEHGSAVVSALFGPEGKRVVTASVDGRARLWDAAIGQPDGQALRHASPLRSAYFSPDGGRVVSSADDLGGARLWEVASGRLLGDPLRHQDHRVFEASFSPDGTRVVTASDDHTAQIWDAATGERVGPALRHEDGVSSASFSPDGSLVVTVARNWAAGVWNAVGGEALGERIRHRGPIVSASISPDGRSLLTAWNEGSPPDEGPDLARLWDPSTGQPIGPSLQNNVSRREEDITSASFSRDGSRILSGLYARALVFDSALEPLRTLEAERFGDLRTQIVSAAFSPDGSRVVTAGENAAWLWDEATGQRVGVPLSHEGRVGMAVFDPDGARVVTVSDDSARVWDAVSGLPLGGPLRHQAEVLSATFDAEGDRILTASKDGTARLWDAEIGTETDSAVLADLAELVVGYRLSELRALVPIREPRRELARLAQAAGTGEGFGWHFVRWFLSDRRERTVSPLSTQPLSDYCREEQGFREEHPYPKFELPTACRGIVEEGPGRSPT